MQTIRLRRVLQKKRLEETLVDRFAIDLLHPYHLYSGRVPKRLRREKVVKMVCEFETEISLKVADAMGWQDKLDITLAEYAEDHINDRADAIGEGTLDYEWRYLANYVASTIGNIPLKRLTMSDVQRCVPTRCDTPLQ